MRRLAVVLCLLVTGCADSVWLPTVGLPWWSEEGLVPAERVDGDCELRFVEVVVGLPSVGLRDDEGGLWTAPPGQAVDLAAGLRTLGEVRVPEAGDYSIVELVLGAPGELEPTAADGGASADQRVRLRAGGFATLEVRCGDDVATVELELPESAVACPLPADLEVTAQGSFATLAVLDPVSLLGSEPVDVGALLDGPPEPRVAGWTNADGAPCAGE